MAKMWEPQPREVYNNWIETIMSEASDKLSSWEMNFIDSLQGRLNWANLTEPQAIKLEELYVKHTS